MSHYARGAAFERRVLVDLQALGFVAVRSAGSHSPVDVVAARGGLLLLVQCKTDGRCDPEDWNAVVAAAEQAGGVPLLASRVKRAIVYARMTNRKTGRRGQRAPLEPFLVGA